MAVAKGRSVGCMPWRVCLIVRLWVLQEDEFVLSQAIQEGQAKVHEALLDNINTAAALDALSGLIKATNQYLATKQAAATANGISAAAAGGDAASAAGLAAGGPQPLLLRKAAAYVTRILSVFGLLPVSEWAPCCVPSGQRRPSFCIRDIGQPGWNRCWGRYWLG